jgi:hypothetical protein
MPSNAIIPERLNQQTNKHTITKINQMTYENYRNESNDGCKKAHNNPFLWDDCWLIM